MSGNDLRVYIFRGKEGERVPITAVKLVVDPCVQALPEVFCNYSCVREVTLPDGLKVIGESAFKGCDKLSEMRICNTVEYIMEGGFSHCKLLTKVEFEFSTSSPHQLQAIDDNAFYACDSLPRIKLPSSVNALGECAFSICRALIEANLSTCGVKLISQSTFIWCYSLQTVSLPNTLEQISKDAFRHCSKLITVVVPLDSKPIKIGKSAFGDCRQLANLALPKDSTTQEDSFAECELLNERYGNESSRIVAGLTRRFNDFPIHRICYDYSHSSSSTYQKLCQSIAEQQEGGSLVDTFGMNPFHVLFSTAEPSMKLLEVLLHSLPLKGLLNWHDATDRTPLEYLIDNWTAGTKSLLLMTLQTYVIDPIFRWGGDSRKWAKEMKTKVGVLLCEHDHTQRLILLNDMYFAFYDYGKMESTSILELALWKCKLKSGWTSDGTKRQALDRVESRCLSGSDVVIPIVTGFLYDDDDDDDDDEDDDDDDE